MAWRNGLCYDSKGDCTKTTTHNALNLKFVLKTIYHLEQAALSGHHDAYSIFHLGLVHAFGCGGLTPNLRLSHQWMIASGLSQGLYIASRQAQALSPTSDGLSAHQAAFLVCSAEWRNAASDQTCNVDLNFGS